MKNEHSWIDAWTTAVKATWPNEKRRPGNEKRLLSLARDISFVAPESRGVHARKAWEVYEVATDPVIARAAVGLTYAICSTVPA